MRQPPTSPAGGSPCPWTWPGCLGSGSRNWQLWTTCWPRSPDTGGARATDLVARLGGDEFLVLLDAVGLSVAVGRARVLLQAIASSPWIEIADGLDVSVSIGLAAGVAGDIDDLLEAADKNLYQVKKSVRGTLRHT